MKCGHKVGGGVEDNTGCYGNYWAGYEKPPRGPTDREEKWDKWSYKSKFSEK